MAVKKVRLRNSDVRFITELAHDKTYDKMCTSKDSDQIQIPAKTQIRYARACSNYQDFMERWKVLTTKLLSQEYQKTKLVATLMKFYGRHHDLVNPYSVAVSRIVSDVFANDEP